MSLSMRSISMSPGTSFLASCGFPGRATSPPRRCCCSDMEEAATSGVREIWTWRDGSPHGRALHRSDRRSVSRRPCAVTARCTRIPSADRGRGPRCHHGPDGERLAGTSEALSDVAAVDTEHHWLLRAVYGNTIRRAPSPLRWEIPLRCAVFGKFGLVSSPGFHRGMAMPDRMNSDAAQRSQRRLSYMSSGMTSSFRETASSPFRHDRHVQTGG